MPGATDEPTRTQRSAPRVASVGVRLDEFDYPLAHDHIAQTPIEPRDAARLLVDRGGADPEHRVVGDLAAILCPGDVLVVNDTKVRAARLRLARATGGAAEVLLLAPCGDRTWTALVRPGRKLRPGEVLLTGDGTELVRIGDRGPAGTRRVELLTDDTAAALGRYGELPLPPYITSPLGHPARYQTVYARRSASVAAPTAGLHLTSDLLARLRRGGVVVAAVELVVGLDTFAPVTEEDPRRHHIHREQYCVPEATISRCGDAERVVAVGTTATRALESAVATGELEGSTDLFIHRGYEWKIVDLMLTNFHLPRTTLLMMIDAFIGPRWHRLYDIALAGGYRFASFGDAMLLDRRAR